MNKNKLKEAKITKKLKGKIKAEPEQKTKNC